jgi:hypothetical protein|tara:strand:- start:703 stop:981 length:279 start_codon:yes stop_codon:yes gene_type:complete
MPNEKYSFLGGNNPSPLRKYDPILDFRDMVVKMRNMQTHFNNKGGKQNLFDAVKAENDVDKMLFGVSGTRFDDEKDNRMSLLKLDAEFGGSS